ncbi:MAG TPA: spermidine/putrescine ABC transporter substrate-binding protein [Longimicrobiales bacterium]|nr:spermidine/putrescine ABC transporter substrate-binding protein [Longimicrobiales bacterium]
MKHALLPLCILLIGSACADPPAARPDIIEAYGTTVHRDSLGATLRLFIWPDYIDPALLQEFEHTYGVRVMTDYYDTNEALIAKLMAGGIGQYDVIVASDYAVEVLESGTLLLPLHHANIPNLRNLEPRFRALPFDSANVYSATYQWGTTGLGVRMDLLRDSALQLDSWALVFDPAAHPGPIIMLADARETIGAALLYLGYSANTTDSTQLAAAERLLVQQRARVLTYAPFASGRDLLASGDAVVAHNYSGDVLTVQQEVPGVRYIIPREGAILWTDNMAVPAQAPARRTAELFINFVLDPQIGARLANFTRYASPNAAALPHIDAALRTDPAIYPDSTLLSRLEVLRDVGPARALYDRIWTRLRAAR